MTLTPMMRQYQEAKDACPGALLLFRMGDFYELFHDDARTAAQLLGLALTSRDKGENPVPMAGFPHHQLEAYLAKLITAGVRVAICDQVEDPRQAKGIVKRSVTRVVSRGTVTDEGLLDPQASNFLAAVVPGYPIGLAWVDLSTGRFWATTTCAARLADELARIEPVECLLPDEAPALPPQLAEKITITRRPNWAFSHSTGAEALARHFKAATLEGFGFSRQDVAPIRAAGAVLDYLRETQAGVASLDHIDRLIPYEANQTLQIDEASRRSLEITRTLRDGRREGALLGVLDRTVTAMGARLLADWLANPLAARGAIEARLDAVEEFLAEGSLCDAVRELLRGIHDLQRLLARVATGRASPRDLSYLGRTLGKLPALRERLADRRSTLLQNLYQRLDLCPEIRDLLAAALMDDCPLSYREGGFIRDGYRAELDELRELAAGGKKWIAQYQAQEAERSGIPNIKVGFNKVFGYYLEVTHAQSAKIPAHFIRKQTIKNAERYVTPELKEYEERVLSAQELAQSLEAELFVDMRGQVAATGGRLQRTAEVLAELDVLAGLAELARERGYCRPELVDEPVLVIDQGRHPVLDALLPAGQFVPNDTWADPERGWLMLITGPNMAGKSTYIRQVALLALLAQVGSFVPARRATIGIVDRIFARVGASDEIARGQSTFMVEMTETARILNTATSRSLVILDEIGRGTSTYDGISLAWSVVEHLHDVIGCRTLFATHYHELTELANLLSGVRNWNVAVQEWEGEVVFLHRIVPGAADQSYGIHVARLAGVPRSVNERARQILGQLESQHVSGNGQAARSAPVESIPRPKSAQLSLFEIFPEHPLLEKIRALDLDQIAPLAAWQLIDTWQEELRSVTSLEKRASPARIRT